MPVLASAHAAADPATRAQIELVFGAITEYGGGIGEILGVSLFMALSLGTLCVAALRAAACRGGWPAPGVVSALLLAGWRCRPAHRSAGAGGGRGAMLSLWMLVAGVWLLLHAPRLMATAQARAMARCALTLNRTRYAGGLRRISTAEQVPSARAAEGRSSAELRAGR